MDVDVHALKAPSHALDLVGLRGVVRAQEVMPDVDVGHRVGDRRALVVELVGLELADDSLLVGLHVLGPPLGEQLVVLRACRIQRRPDGGVLLTEPDVGGSPVALLEGHARGVEAGAGDRVAVAHVEQVVEVTVEVGDVEALEGLGHRTAVDVVDPVQRGLADLVIHRVGVRREEVGRTAHLVGVDEQLRRQLSQHLELGVGLGLGAREPVAVHVEAVGVATRVGLPAVRVLRRQYDDDRVVEDLLSRAVAAGGQLVEDAQRRVGAALLAAVDVAGDPENGRHLADDPAGLGLGCPLVS